MGYTWRVLLVAIAVTLAAYAPGAAQVGRPSEVLTGGWDWEAAPKRCQENPHSISFTRDGTRMEIRHPKGAVVAGGDRLPDPRRRAAGAAHADHRIIGETRTTEQGEPVVWDLILLSRDAYCWRRTDWPQQSCTGRVLRCPVHR